VLRFVLILMIASIPVAMPAVLSITMALGALALSKKKAIVSKLESIEEMAAAARAAAAFILTAPGLSVIIKAVESARQIFERMTSYATYRIAMTLFQNFRPLTPVMIIILALLDDIPIMTIAYDNAKTSETPVRWDMGRILSVSIILGLLSVIQSSGLLYVGCFFMAAS